MAVNCISVEILEINNEDANISPLCKSLFFNAKRYVAVSNIKLGSRDLRRLKKMVMKIVFSSIKKKILN